MATCTACGSAVDDQARSCPSCDAPIAASINPRAHGYPPPVHPGGPGYPRRNPFLSGDWLGAVLAVAACVGVMTVLALGSLVLFDVGQENRFPAVTFLAGTASLLALAFGGALASGPGPLSDIPPIRPLTLALVGFALLGYVFVRRLRRSGAVTQAGAALQAVRIVVVGLGALIVVSLVGQLNQRSTGLAGLDVGGALDRRLAPDIASTLAVGVVSLLIALFIAALLGLPGVLGRPGSAERAWTALAASLRGVLAAIVAACVLTLAFLAIQTAFDVRDMGTAQAISSAENETAQALIDLPNMAGGLFLISLGVPTKAGVAVSLTGADRFIMYGQEHVTVVDLIERQSRFWFLLAGAAVVMAVGAFVATRNRPPTVDRARGVAWFAGVFAATMFLSAFLIGIGATASPLIASLTDRFGFNPFLVFVFSAFWALAGALAMLRVPPRIRPMPPPPLPYYYPR
jgi:hypothetical protein